VVCLRRERHQYEGKRKAGHTVHTMSSYEHERGGMCSDEVRGCCLWSPAIGAHLPMRVSQRMSWAPPWHRSWDQGEGYQAELSVKCCQ
jgi:hypothetical protein